MKVMEIFKIIIKLFTCRADVRPVGIKLYPKDLGSKESICRAMPNLARAPPCSSISWESLEHLQDVQDFLKNKIEIIRNIINEI